MMATCERTVDACRREVAGLQEYRARLIADAVTGKLDVRETAARLADLDPMAAEAKEGEQVLDGVDAERTEGTAAKLMAEGR